MIIPTHLNLHAIRLLYLAPIFVAEVIMNRVNDNPTTNADISLKG